MKYYENLTVKWRCGRLVLDWYQYFNITQFPIFLTRLPSGLIYIPVVTCS